MVDNKPTSRYNTATSIAFWKFCSSHSVAFNTYFQPQSTESSHQCDGYSEIMLVTHPLAPSRRSQPGHVNSTIIGEAVQLGIQLPFPASPVLSTVVSLLVAMTAAMTADQKLVKQSWQKAYKAALDADIWGQADDAHDNYYKSISTGIAARSSHTHSLLSTLTSSVVCGRADCGHCRLSENIDELTSHIGLGTEEKVSHKRSI